MVRLAAEFPTDNDAMHLGTAWVVLEIVSAPTPERRAHVVDLPVRASVPSLPPCGDGRASGIVATDARFREARTLDELATAFDDELSTDALLDALDGFDEWAEGQAFVVEDFDALGKGDRALAVEATPIADLVTEEPVAPADPYLMLVERLAELAASSGSPDAATAVTSLLRDRTLDPGLSDEGKRAVLARGIVDARGALTSTFSATMDGWRNILRGTSDDLGPCGSAMLDEWAADLLAHLLGTPGLHATLRTELRARGIAAFGLADAA